MYEIAYGKKYQQGLDVKEIAKRVRSEIAAEVAPSPHDVTPFFSLSLVVL
jgi:hypothetical protein